MKERSGIVARKGNPLTLLGPELKVGDGAPDFEVIDNDLQPVRLSSFRGKICLIASVPSLDTPVCDIETRRFNTEAGKLSPEIQDHDHQHGPALRPKALVRGGRSG